MGLWGHGVLAGGSTPAPCALELEATGHALDALFLFGVAGVDVEIQGGGDGGVAEDDGDGLVVSLVFDAAGGEAEAQAVEADAGDA